MGIVMHNNLWIYNNNIMLYYTKALSLHTILNTLVMDGASITAK